MFPARVAIYRLLLAGLLIAVVFPGPLAADIVSLDNVPLSTIRHDRSDSSYRNLASSYEATGRLTWPGFLCSGNFIRNSGPFGWVLTAAHCLDDGTPADEFSFAVGGMSYVGDAIFTAPTYTNFEESVERGDDIALLRLATTVMGVTPAKIYSGSSELDKLAVNVGFGATGTGLSGAQSGTAGTKRAVRNMVDAFFSGQQLASDFDNPDNTSDSLIGDEAPVDLEGLIASGDSGGGLYIDFGAGPELAGIHSFVSATREDGNPNSDYGDLSGSTRVSRHAAWIESTIALNSVAVPEPSTYVLTVILGVLAAARRLRWQNALVSYVQLGWLREEQRRPVPQVACWTMTGDNAACLQRVLDPEGVERGQADTAEPCTEPAAGALTDGQSRTAGRRRPMFWHRHGTKSLPTRWPLP